MPYKAGKVFDGVRALMNDQEIAVYTNAVILPYFEMAFENLRQELEDNSIPITYRTTGAITISTGITDIGGPTGPALPEDLIEVLECWEIPAGTNDNYMLMKRKQFLPKTSVLTAYLEVWQWANEYVHFLGANGAIQVKLDYIANSLANVSNEDSIIRVSNSINYLKFGTAALCSMFIGENESRATTLGDMANQALEKLLNIPIKNAQGISTRRRPFMAGYKLRGALYGR